MASIRLFVVVMLALMVSGGCDTKGPLGPSGQSNPSQNQTILPTPNEPQPDPETTVLTTIPGSQDTFRWWITSVDPRFYVVQIGQTLAKIEWKCSTTSGSLPGVIFMVTAVPGPSTPDLYIFLQGGEGGGNTCGGGTNAWMFGYVNGMPSGKQWIRLRFWFKDLRDIEQIFPKDRSFPTIPPDAMKDMEVDWSTAGQ